MNNKRKRIEEKCFGQCIAKNTRVINAFDVSLISEWYSTFSLFETVLATSSV